ncbi:hypothetical protein Bca52824_005466 [Brassica carinata]|uniref:F-box associated beta-propeller type 1 domain-containing protein n=2 Tax=Brassica TaxID=3705 RepID=A0A8X7WQW3_BRACI|nr:hypothetical protein Bca52824_005466 [Brassica carinata]
MIFCVRVWFLKLCTVSLTSTIFWQSKIMNIIIYILTSQHPKHITNYLSLDIPGLESQKLVNCDEFLICSTDTGAAVCNPWLKQITWIRETRFRFHGIGYPHTNSKGEKRAYKTIWYNYTKWKIHDLASGTGVLMNGNLFWIISFDETKYHLETFDFSREGFYRFCDLPCRKRHPLDALVLRVFKGDRFSVLKQSKVTKKIEIWVTKNKVNVEDGKSVGWMRLMNFSIPNFPRLAQATYYQQPSYFIDNNERLVVCCCDKTGKPWIYVMGDNKLISKVHLDSVADPWPLHCTCFPSLVPVPRGQRDEPE